MQNPLFQSQHGPMMLMQADFHETYYTTGNEWHIGSGVPNCDNKYCDDIVTIHKLITSPSSLYYSTRIHIILKSPSTHALNRTRKIYENPRPGGQTIATV